MFKKSVLFLGVLACAATANLSANDETTQFEPFTGSIVGSKVRLRTQPNLESHVVRETSQGELFAVMSETSDYYAVSPPKGTKGYVFRTYILEGKVEADRVNVRLYPDIEAPVIARLNTGDEVEAVVSDINSRWLEVELPQSAHFYVAKEYLEKKGDVELIGKLEKRHAQATHHLSSAFSFAKSEIQKPFEQIDLDQVNHKFEQIVSDYADLKEIVEQTREAGSVIQDIYLQKKIAFLESKADRKPVTFQIHSDHLDRLAKLGIELHPSSTVSVEESVQAEATSEEHLSTQADDALTDKMRAWLPLEESFYHLWVAVKGEKNIEEFYKEEKQNATVLSGIVEPYTRPVKNRPGDFILKCDNLPVAFLYSTRVNLEKMVGKKVTVVCLSRPNHHFAFPAYFVLNVD